MKKALILTLLFVAGLIGFWFWQLQGAQEDKPKNWPLTWDATPRQIIERCDNARTILSTAVDKLAATPLDQVKWQALLDLEAALANNSFATDRLDFYSSIHPNKDHRDAAEECSKANSKFYVDLFTREDLFKVVEKAAQFAPADPVRQLLASDYMRGFRENGMHLPKAVRAELIELRKRMIDLGSEYQERLNNWSDPTWVSKSQLVGMPDAFIGNLEHKDGKYKLTLDYPHYYPIMELGQDPKLREELEVKFLKRGGERNRKLFQEMLQLRFRVAKILGYQSHAQFVLEDRMAKTPETVSSFLDTLTGQLRQKTEEDLGAMVKLKQAERKDPTIKNIEPWDWRYYAHQITKQRYDIDHDELAKYFPLNKVLAGMFEIYQTLFNVRFIEVIDAPKWHPTVQIYAITDSVSQEPRAYFYMDLYPREGKYGHAAAFTLVSGRRLVNGAYEKPVSAIVANFTTPTENAPSLLKHEEVETLFHEFGHIMHAVLTTAEYSSQSGTNVKRDFVEAPSQMLENWVWHKDSLGKMSGHYQTGAAIPEALVAKLIASKAANIGITYSRQAFFAQIDMAYHRLDNDRPVDTTALWSKLQQEIMLVGIPSGTYPEANFGHLMSGYDAGYYGYLWSKVFAQDMFTRFEQNGLFDPATGHEYLQRVLQPGGSRDPNELIQNFLGRPSNQTAFLRSLGITSKAE
jgi:Zn-dependent oligopeptidase